MKITMKAILGLSFLSATALAQGNGAGNGGGVHYCPNPKPGQKMYETYDLWITKNTLDETQRKVILDYDGKTTKAEYLSRAIEKVRKLSPLTADAILRALVLYGDHVRPNQTPSGQTIELSKVSGANDLFHESGCEYFQLVNWIDPQQARNIFHFGDPQILKNGLILRDDLVYKSEWFDPLNQAAIDFHEAAYKVRRSFGLEDASGTVLVQQFTGQAFSESEIDSALVSQISLYLKPEKYFQYLISKEPDGHYFKKFSDHQKVVILPAVCERNAEVEFTIENIGSTIIKSEHEFYLEPGKKVVKKHWLWGLRAIVGSGWIAELKRTVGMDWYFQLQSKKSPGKARITIRACGGEISFETEVKAKKCLFGAKKYLGLILLSPTI